MHEILYFTNFTKELYYAIKLPEREVEILLFSEDDEKAVYWLMASQKFISFLVRHMHPSNAATYKCVRRQLHEIITKTARRNIDRVYQYATD